MVEPEVVATSPNRIKSPVPVYCGFSSVKMVPAAGIAPALATLSTSYLFCWTTRAMKWSLEPVLPRQSFFTEEVRRLLQGGKMARRAEAQRAKVGRNPECCPRQSWL